MIHQLNLFVRISPERPKLSLFTSQQEELERGVLSTDPNEVLNIGCLRAVAYNHIHQYTAGT